MNIKSIAVVGPGLIGTKHIELINNNPMSRLVAIVAPAEAENLAIATKEVVPLYQKIENLLSKEYVDGIIIASPNTFHVMQASVCIENNIPVLIEKPIAHTYQAGLALLELIDRKKAKVIVGHHRAHSPIMQTARKIIADQVLGRLVAITGNALFFKPKDYFESGVWRTKLGGGPILINLIHEIGNFRALCGEIVAVQAIASNQVRQFEVEDTVAIVFQFANGVLGTFLLSDTAASAASWEMTSQENPSYPRYSEENCYLVAGTQGSLAIPTMKIKTYNTVNDASWWKPFTENTIFFEKKDPLACQFDHFLRVIEGSESPLVTAFDGVQNLKVIEAIQVSILKKQLVYV